MKKMTAPAIINTRYRTSAPRLTRFSAGSLQNDANAHEAAHAAHSAMITTAGCIFNLGREGRAQASERAGYRRRNPQPAHNTTNIHCIVTGKCQYGESQASGFSPLPVWTNPRSSA